MLADFNQIIVNFFGFRPFLRPFVVLVEAVAVEVGRDVASCSWVGGFVPGAADFVVEGWFWVADDFWFKNRVGTSFEPQNRCFRRFLGQKSSWYLFRTAKSMFLTIFGSKIELVPLSNRKIDVFDDF